MKFLADENVDKPIVERLRKDSHEVLYVLEIEPSISDDEVIQRTNQDDLWSCFNPPLWVIFTA